MTGNLMANYRTTVRSAPAVTPGSGVGVEETAFNPSQPSNLTKTTGSSTTRFFNNYFVKTDSISVHANDAIVSYFEQQTGNRKSAKVLAQAVLNTASQQGDDPMKVLDEFRSIPTGDLNAFLTLYLNASRVSTSLLGIQNVPHTNKYVARTILP